MMKILNFLQDPTADWDRKLPASRSLVEALPAESGLALPDDYLALLEFSNGGEGELGVEPGWFILWPVEEVMELNRGYQIEKWLPGYFGFGSSGGGEMLAFNIRTWQVVMVPFIGMEEEYAKPIACDIAEFIKMMGRTMPDT